MNMIDTVELGEFEAIKHEAMEALLRQLGPAKTAIVIRDLFAQKTDYLKLKDELWSGGTVKELAQKIQGQNR
jgi:hypothetical protein